MIAGIFIGFALYGAVDCIQDMHEMSKQVAQEPEPQMPTQKQILKAGCKIDQKVWYLMHRSGSKFTHKVNPN